MFAREVGDLEGIQMDSTSQKERAERFRAMHHAAPMLVLPNVWDAASARVIELAGFPAIATTSAGVALALGYRDGQRMSRDMMIEAIGRVARVVTCPVTADIEAGYGADIAEVIETVKTVIGAGAVGFNIEDSRPGGATLVDVGYQTELIAALRELASTLDIPFVINARVDVYLKEIGEPESRFEQTVSRASAYLRAGADCAYPIGVLPGETIAELVKAIHGPINIMGGPRQPPLSELERYGVARVSLAGSVFYAMLGHLRAVAQDIRERGDYSRMTAESLSSAEVRSLFPE
jgi:2-methylisocitrate lyase-like PEP mutase family enzyme